MNRVSALLALLGRTLEHTCMLWLGLMTRSIKHTNFSIGVNLTG